MKYKALTTALILALALASLPASAAPPRPSPTATVSQVVGVSNIEITYARPSVKERKIWGELVPYGKVWRTGANEATRFTLAHDATVEGKPLAAGTYALFTLPEKDKWTVIFNKEAEQWGNFQHKEEQDALRVEVSPRKDSHHEQFEISIDDVTSTSASVVLHWEKLAIPFEVQFDTNKIAWDVALEEAAKNPQATYGWAQYFYQQNIYTEKALEWASAAVEARPIYWTRSLQARLQQRAGQKAVALETAKKAIGEADNQFAKNDAAKLEEEMAGW